jgi:acid phosphatase (class A)
VNTLGVSGCSLEVFMRRVAGALLCLLAIVVCSVHAVGATVGSGAQVAVDAVAVVGPPPAPGSDEAKADLAVVLWLQRTRTQEDIARAQAEVKVELETFVSAFGPGFDATAHPRTRALLDRLHEEASPFVDRAREHFARPRPFVAEPRVQSAVKRESSPSYPSSHGTRGVLYARVLAELVPARRDALLEVGRRLGYDRVLAGVHYPSDVLAGQRLGEALAEAMLATPAFRAEISELRAAEWGGTRQ